jgi:F420-dependent oxidoreductase-like protein
VKIAMMLDYTHDFLTTASRAADLERAGLDQVWVPEPYGNDAISQVGYLAARTERLEIGTGIINVYSRTPALVAMTAAGCDYLTSGRFQLGLGASGPQVIEGFHGVPYDKPMQRIREYIESCRMIWRREPYVYEGQTVRAPLMAPEGSGLGRPVKLITTPVRSSIPIWWASLMGKSVTATAELADGWLPTMFLPEDHGRIWGAQLKEGLAKRSEELGPLQIAAGGVLNIDSALSDPDLRAKALAPARASTALYVGGMGARTKNFYNDVMVEYGFGGAAREIQDLFLGGEKQRAAQAVPDQWLERTNLVGPDSLVAERVAAYREAGVTVLMVGIHVDDPVAQIERLRGIVDR